MKKITYFLLAVALSFSGGQGGLWAKPSGEAPQQQGPSLQAQQALLMDGATGEILFERNAHEPMAPSSMTKILTTYVVFDHLKRNLVKMTDTFSVSEEAWRRGGSTMFLKLNSKVSLEDLLRGAIVQSGNDACITLAKKLAGSEEAFAKQMTQVAHELGATHSNFVNATGWPEDQHYSTAYDLAVIARKLIENFPEYYPLYAEREFTYNNIYQMNRNPLLGSFPGADGLKTGATDAGKFGLVGSAVQKGWRLILVINGSPTKKTRALDSKSLMQWGFSHFIHLRLYKKGEVIEEAQVWLGKEPKIGLTLREDAQVTLPRQDLKNVKVELVYTAPLAAPVSFDQPVGKLVVSLPHKEEKVFPVFAVAPVEKAGFFSRIKLAIFYLLKGHN